MMLRGENPFHQVPFDEFGFVADGREGKAGVPVQKKIAIGREPLCPGLRAGERLQ